MKRVLKWTVPVDDDEHKIGAGPVALVACQHGSDTVQVWTEEEHGSSASFENARNVRVYGTGHLVPVEWEHLGSVIVGRFVWHLYAEPVESDLPGGSL